MSESAPRTCDSLRQFLPWLAALCLIVLGAKLWLVQLYGSPLPYWDQWYEADEFLRPWKEGTLTWGAFFAAHNEHRIFCTRLFDLSVIWLNGRWDTLLQMTLNAFLHTAFVGMLAGCLWDFLGRKRSWLICLLLVPFYALPYAAENTLHGFDASQYFLSLFSLSTLVGLGFGRTGGLHWWLGLVSAVLSLFTLESGLLAPLAAGALIVFRALKQRQFPRSAWITLAVCIVLVVAGVALSVTVPRHEPLRSKSVPELAFALIRNLSWPFLNSTLLACLIAAPTVVLAVVYFRRGFRATRAAEFLLVFALWGVLQSAALAYGRASPGEYPASRYMDVLNAFALAGLFSLLVLQPELSSAAVATGRDLILPLVFGGLLAWGMGRLAHSIVAEAVVTDRLICLEEAERIETYWSDRDTREFLTPPTVRPDPELALRVLGNTSLQPILPEECLPPDAKPRAGWLSLLSQSLRRHGAGILATGCALWIVLSGYQLARGRVSRLERLAHLVPLLVAVAGLGYVWQMRSVRRETIEKGMHEELARIFKPRNEPKRSEYHERKARESMAR